MDVVELNLEDAFIEYTRGPRRPLAFLGEEETGAKNPAAQRVA